ncbi:uncharacterized protein LOC144452388 [Glandiceps talaboti]
MALLATAPIECKPSLWKRYVDDILEIIKDGQVDNLTSHLNTIDKTNNIKFTHEPEEDNKIPFLDILITKKSDGTVKLCVYRKKTHTDQYLNFRSHHPLYHKLGVIRTLLDRMNNIVAEEADKTAEEQHIMKALEKCGYPKWTINKVKKDIQKKQELPGQRKKHLKKMTDQRSMGMVILPYIQGTTEATCVKPYSTLRKELVHPKDKIEKEKQCGVVYEIPCRNCDQSYIGETGRQFSYRLKEHSSEVEVYQQRSFTRSTRRASVTEMNKSAITDHVRRTNHVLEWEGTKIADKETDRYQRWIREAICIKKRGSTMNRDEGAYNLSTVWTGLLSPIPLRGKQF